MSRSLSDLVTRFSELRALVVGDSLLDRYLEGAASRLCREAPVPVLFVSDQQEMPGGAANVAMNMAALGMRAQIVSVCGNDNCGTRLQSLLQQGGVDTSTLVLSPHASTPCKSRLIGNKQILARFDFESREPLCAADESSLLEALDATIPQADLVVLSDYGYQTFTPAVLERLRELQERRPRTLVADSTRRLDLFSRLGVTAAKPNYQEACSLLGFPAEEKAAGRVQTISDNGERLLERCGASLVAVSLDRDGAILFERERPPYRTYSRPVPDSAAVGAGDSFVAALAAALALGADANSAGEIAARAGTVVIEKCGTATCSAAELQASLHAVSKLITDLGRFERQLLEYRRQGKQIVFANGCFDILHSGHIRCLSRARELGDVLIVAVNDDESIRRVKGEGRPINKLEDRLRVLNALNYVDHLVSFSDDTAVDLVRLIRPEVFVKGPGVRPEDLPERSVVEESGGKIEILAGPAEKSTSRIIGRIKGAAASSRPVPSGRAASCWADVKRALAVRLDTIGDVLMTEPALRALRETHGFSLTLLTSSRGAAAAELIEGLDAVLTYDVPWMKATSQLKTSSREHRFIMELAAEQFDAAIIFTSYSQSSLPAALTCYLAGIPLRAAYCRENPYQLLTDWAPEHEPDKKLRHEVQRHLDLAAVTGAQVRDPHMRISISPAARMQAERLLLQTGVNRDSFFVVHPGASAPSRRYPEENFSAVVDLLCRMTGMSAILTGSAAETDLIERIRSRVSAPTHSLAGRVSLEELAALISRAPLLVSNNTGPAHVAAAVGTPVVDIYALTNPQHTPWMVPNRVLYHDVPCKFCYKSLCPEGHHNCLRMLEPSRVAEAAAELLLETARSSEPARASSSL